MEQLTWSYPTWFIVFCLLAGAVYAGALYVRDTTFRESGTRTQTWLKGLALLRFLSISLIAFLLLSPFFRIRSTESEAPIIVLIDDRSVSVGEWLSNTDSSTYEQQLVSLKNALQDQYRVDHYHFGEGLFDPGSEAFSARQTDLSMVMKSLYEKYVNQNLGAVILATDGMYNKGSNPLYSIDKVDAPVFPLALGDTTQQRDIRIRQVQHNSIGYLGDKLELRLTGEAYRAQGKSTTLTVTAIDLAGNRTVRHQETFSINEPSQLLSTNVLFELTTQGVQQIEISFSGIDAEQTLTNNATRIFIDVLDSRQQILLLAHAPHPDLTALKAALEANRNNEVTIRFTADPLPNLKEMDLVIVHQLPVVPTDAAFLSQIDAAGVPQWKILGDQTNLTLFNRSQNLIAINSSNGTTNEVQGSVAGDFSLFKLPEGLSQQIGKLPPLFVPFGTYAAATDAHPLLWQRIGSVVTSYPLLVFRQRDQQREAILAGTGIWRWRLVNYLQQGNHNLVDELIQKTVQYLAIKSDKRKFRVTQQKKIFDENESVLLEAELYNDLYELVNDPDVSLSITNEAGEQFPYQFSRTARSYSVNAGAFPTGNYSYTATTTYNGQPYQAAGQFSIRPIDIELQRTAADHSLLYQMAEQTGGEVFYPAEWESLAQAISEREDVKPLLRDKYSTEAIINLKWLFFVVLFLLAVEWFVRKYNGAY